MLLALLLFVPLQDQLLVSSFQPAAVRSFDAATGALSTTLGPGSPLAGALGSTIGPDGRVYIASETTDEVLRYDAATGAFMGAFVSDDPATAMDETGGLAGPSGVVFGPDGGLYVGSFNSDAVLRYDGRSGAFDRIFVAPGSGGLNGPDAGMAFGPNGDLFVPSFWNRRVKRYDGGTGAFVVNAFTPAVSGLRNPRAVVFDGGGRALVTSEGTDQVLRFDATGGAFVDVLVGDDPSTPIDESGGLDGPSGIVLAADGSLLVASVATGDVKRYSAAGAYLGNLASGVATPVHLTLRPGGSVGCVTQPNSVGEGAFLVARGSSSVAANRLSFELSYGPPSTLAILVQGGGAPPQAVGDGTLCLGGSLFRVAAATTDGLGRARFALDLTSPRPPAAAILVGSTWDFQVGYVDPGATGPRGINFSSSVRILFGL